MTPVFEGGVGHLLGGHRRIRLVAHIVVAGDKVTAPAQADRVDLRQCLTLGSLEVGAAGEFLHQITQMHDESRLEGGHHLPGDAGALALPAARLELERAVAGIDHVVGIGDDGEFQLCRRQQGAIESGHGRPT